MANTSGDEGSSSDPTEQSPPRSPTGTETLDRPIARSPPPPPAAATRPTQPPPPPPPMAVDVANVLRALMNLTSETVAPGGSSPPTTGDDVLYRPVGRFVLLPTVPPHPTASPPPQPSIGATGTSAFRPFKNSPPEVGVPGGSSQPTGAGTLQRRIDRLVAPPTTLPPPPPPPPPVSPPSSQPMGVPSDGGAGSSEIGKGEHQQPPQPPVVGGGGVGADVAEEGGRGGEEEEDENVVVPEPEDD